MLKVGVIGARGADTLTANIFDSLTNMGMRPVDLGPVGLQTRFSSVNTAGNHAKRLSAHSQFALQKRVVRNASDNPCDVILTADKELLPETVRRLREVAGGVALWYPDHVANVSRMSFAVAPYSGVFVTDPLLASRLSDVYGVRAHYLPEACNPDRHRPLGEPGKDPHIAVVGNFQTYRVALLKRLKNDGIPLKLYGPPIAWWIPAGSLAENHTGEYVVNEHKARIFREARGVLNNLHPAEMTSVNCRLFEATASGAVVITENRPTLGPLFDIGSEVLAFDSYQQLLEMCRAVVSKPDEFRAMGDAASARAHLDHTYELRLRELLSKVL